MTKHCFHVIPPKYATGNGIFREAAGGQHESGGDQRETGGRAGGDQTQTAGSSVQTRHRGRGRENLEGFSGDEVSSLFFPFGPIGSSCSAVQRGGSSCNVLTELWWFYPTSAECSRTR